MIGKFLRRKRTELRDSSYTDLVLRGLDATARGSDASALVTGSVEIAAGVWGRALASGVVTGTDALTARVRHRLGRDLIRYGDSVFQVVTESGRVELAPVSHWEVLAGWRYRLETTEPPGDLRSEVVAREAVAHFQWSESPREPWRGVSPLAAASKLGTLAGRVEGKLAEDLAAPVAYILPIPSDGGSPQLDALRSDIARAEGAALLLEGTSAGFDDGRAQSGTRDDWKVSRLGPQIPESSLVAFRDVQMAVANCCGIPPALMDPAATGTGQREGWRRFYMGSVEPVASLIAEVASEALEVEVSFDFSGTWAHDLTGRASAFQKLVSGGMEVEKAVQVAGLMVGESE